MRSFTADPANISAYGPLTDASGTRSFQLKVVRDTGKGVIARIAGVGDRTAAEALAGVELLVDRSSLPSPEDGAYFHYDLIGLEAVTPAGVPIGTVIAVENFGAGDLLEVAFDGQRTEYVPFRDAFVSGVELELRRIIIHWPLPIATDDDVSAP